MDIIVLLPVDDSSWDAPFRAKGLIKLRLIRNSSGELMWTAGCDIQRRFCSTFREAKERLDPSCQNLPCLPTCVRNDSYEYVAEIFREFDPSHLESLSSLEDLHD